MTEAGGSREPKIDKWLKKKKYKIWIEIGIDDIVYRAISISSIEIYLYILLLYYRYTILYTIVYTIYYIISIYVYRWYTDISMEESRRETFIAMQIYPKKQERSEINYLTLYLKEVEKEHI